MALLVKLVFASTAGRTLREFRDLCADPALAQARLLESIVGKNAASAFGRKHGFEKIRTLKDFQKAVPIGDYDSLFPYIDASLKGEPSQLTAERPVFFAVTSGTTGASKFIPVTKHSKRMKSQLMRVWLSGVYRDHPDVFDGRIMTIVSPEVQSYSPGGTPCGAESGHGYRNMPAIFKPLYSCPYNTFEIEDYEAKYYALLRLAAGQDIRMIFTMNPSTILLMADRLAGHTEKIIRDTRDGTLSPEGEIRSDIREEIEAGLTPDPARALELERAAAGGGSLFPRHIWPNLSLLCCWKGGNVGPYLHRFQKYFSEETAIRDIGYLASEHRGSVPLTDSGSAGVLAVGTNVYEFYPAEEEAPSGNPELLGPESLSAGRKYFVYVTTHAGLYRYDMQDIVEVTGFYEKTPLIQFVQKGKGFVSFTGEKLYETQVVGAVEAAFVGRKARYEFIAAVGEFREDLPAYVFLVEFEDPPPGEKEGKDLLCRLDEELRKRNTEYGTKRDSARLDGPILRFVTRGELERYRKKKVLQGTPDSQFKMVQLTADPKFADEFSFDREIRME